MGMEYIGKNKHEEEITRNLTLSENGNIKNRRLLSTFDVASFNFDFEKSFVVSFFVRCWSYFNDLFLIITKLND